MSYTTSEAARRALRATHTHTLLTNTQLTKATHQRLGGGVAGRARTAGVPVGRGAAPTWAGVQPHKGGVVLGHDLAWVDTVALDEQPDAYEEAKLDHPHMPQPAAHALLWPAPPIHTHAAATEEMRWCAHHER